MSILFIFFSLKLKSSAQIGKKFILFNPKITEKKNEFEPKIEKATYKKN